jgi:hypothetical protein
MHGRHLLCTVAVWALFHQIRGVVQQEYERNGYNSWLDRLGLSSYASCATELILTGSNSLGHTETNEWIHRMLMANENRVQIVGILINRWCMRPIQNNKVTHIYTLT